jgi:acyl-coenzyme A thioesterase PaaI-like protein
VETIAHKHHSGCIDCGSGGLGLHFAAQPDGSVEGPFDCAAVYQGYQDRLHGGVVATLADAAMTHCLFARGIVAFTAKPEVTFRHPVRVGREARIRAWLECAAGMLYELRAELCQAGRVCATAHGLFAPASVGPDDQREDGE